MQSQSQSTRHPETPGDDSRAEGAPELKKESKTMTALLWPALTVLAIALIVIIFLALR
jgi:hypothetical protein